MTKLETMLKYVSEHNEFYKNRIKEYGIKDPLDITQWPILTRKELQENRYNMFSDGYKSKYFNQQLRRQSSSGSSGVPVNVYWDYKDWYASNMSLWRKRLQWYGIHPSDKYVMFTLNAFNIKNDGETVYYINDPANILSVNVSLIQNESGYEKLVDIINEFEPKWLYIQPFVLNRLIQVYKRTGKIPPKTLKYIESVGELLASDLRRRAVEFFNVPLANMYGSEEMNGIAYENPKHTMCVLNDNVFLEIDNEKQYDKYYGSAIITNLNNKAMPLIRYNQEDEIEILPENNAYTTILKSIKGRVLNCIILSKGEEINPYTLIEAISEVNNYTKDAVDDFEFIYHKYNNVLEYKLSVNIPDWYDNICFLLESVLKRRLGQDCILQIERAVDYNMNKSICKKSIIQIQEF